MHNFQIEQKIDQKLNESYFVINFDTKADTNEFCEWLQKITIDGGTIRDEQLANNISQHILCNLLEDYETHNCYSRIRPDQITQLTNLLSKMLDYYFRVTTQLETAINNL